MPIFFANARKDKSALSRNSWIRWPKEISIMCQRNKLTPVSPGPCHLAKLDLYEVVRYTKDS